MSLLLDRSVARAYGASVRWMILTACFAGVALFAGCYSPKVGSGGFACSPTDNPPCPSGFFCVNGLCVNDPNAVVPTQDLSTGTGGNGGTGGVGGGGGGMSSVDMAHAAVDMSMPASTDMSMPASSCGMSNDDCTNQPCCSGLICFPFINICT
jgi:hypothetical protein